MIVKEQNNKTNVQNMKNTVKNRIFSQKKMKKVLIFEKASVILLVNGAKW